MILQGKERFLKTQRRTHPKKNLTKSKLKTNETPLNNYQLANFNSAARKCL